MFYKFCFLIDGRIPFFLHYHPTHHPFSPVLNRQARAPSGARAVRFRFYILYFAFFSRVRSAFPAFAGRYSSIQVPAFITSAQHTSDTECCFKNMVENTISTGKTYPIAALPENLMDIIQAGGLVKAMRKRNGLD